MGAVVLAGVLLLQSGIFYRVQPQMLNSLLNWFVVYGTGAWLGLHGKRWVENGSKGPGHIGENTLKGPGPFGENLALTVSGICMLLTGILYGKGINVVFSLLYFLVGAVFFWLLLNKIVKHEAKSWMKLTFFVYASHQMVVSVVTKLGMRILGANAWIGLFLFIAAPIYSFFIAWRCV